MRGRQVWYSIFSKYHQLLFHLTLFIFGKDFFIWPCAAHLSFFWGLYGILQEPGTNPLWRIKLYKGTQGFLCIIWFIFSIISSGS